MIAQAGLIWLKRQTSVILFEKGKNIRVLQNEGIFLSG
jgi:hypothetical protein